MSRTTEFIAFAINQFGSGEHPMAEANSGLEFFARDYAVECLATAIKDSRVRVPGLLVRLYSYSGENEAFESECDASACFPDDPDSFAAAFYDLTMSGGEHVVGGGAAPVFKLFARERWLHDATPASVLASA